MENLIFSLNATVPIFLIMVFGIIFRKIGLIDIEFAEKMKQICLSCSTSSSAF